MGSKAKEPKVEVGRSIYVSEPFPIKGKPIIPIEDD